MKLAFYKAKKGNWWDKLIAIWSYITSFGKYGRYSHTEIVFSDNISFSSSPREGGTRFKHIEFKPEHWDFIEIDPKGQEENIRSWCRSQSGKDYDTFGIIGIAFGTLIGWAVGCRRCLKDQGKWICTESNAFPLKEFGVIDYKEVRMTPDEMWEDTQRITEIWQITDEDIVE